MLAAAKLFHTLGAAAAAMYVSPNDARGAAVQTVSASETEVVVTAARLRATKVDYRLRGSVTTYCRGRNRQQNASAVATICNLVARCALEGARAPRALSDCVEARLAARARQNNMAPPATNRTSGE